MSDTDSRAGARYDSPEILDYVHRVHSPHDAGLARAFAVPDGVPAIQVSPSEGALLGVLIRLAGATKVVEVGTLVGYSAIRIAHALPPGGKLWTIEYSEKHAELARANIAAAGVADKVDVLVGAAVDVLPTLDKHGPFDAVFVDADKENYGRYATWALANVRTGGLVIGDNMYLFGKLAEDTPRGAAVRSFHEQVAAKCDSVCASTPDGLVIGVVR